LQSIGSQTIDVKKEPAEERKPENKCKIIKITLLSSTRREKNYKNLIKVQINLGTVVANSCW